jgi:NAD dependent epimerase/dehydratase
MHSWSGRNVLVTGADGFIGSHLTEALVLAGARVRAFCLYNSNGSLGWLDDSHADIRRTLDVRLGDIRDARFVERSAEGMDVVFHLAALIAIPYSYAATESFVDTNVRGTLHVLEAARRHACGRLVNTSTSEVYGTPDTLPIRETHPLQGQSPYSATKIAADKLCESYFRSFDTPVVTLRPFNTYGPRQSSRAVIPTILAQLIAGRTVVRLGDVRPRRDLTFVSDTVAGFLAAGEAPDVEGQTIHLGTGRADSIEDIFHAAARCCGVSARIETDTARMRPVKSEVLALQSDPSLAARLLKWRATLSLDEGLARTAEWMRANIGRYRPDDYAV